jgi:hypothetical protein
MTAATKPQDNGRQEENHRDDKDHNRVYDRDQKDYHNWNENEDRVYREYLIARNTGRIGALLSCKKRSNERIGTGDTAIRIMTTSTKGASR